MVERGRRIRVILRDAVTIRVLSSTKTLASLFLSQAGPRKHKINANLTRNHGFSPPNVGCAGRAKPALAQHFLSIYHYLQTRRRRRRRRQQQQQQQPAIRKQRRRQQQHQQQQQQVKHCSMHRPHLLLPLALHSIHSSPSDSPFPPFLVFGCVE